MQARGLILSLVCLHACAHHPELKPAPARDAPAAERVKAHDQLRPKALAVSGRDDDDGPQDVAFLILANGARVEDPADLKKIVGRDERLEGFVEEAETNREAWLIYRTVTSVLMGAALILAWGPISDWVRDSESTNEQALKIIGTAVGVIGAGFLLDLPGTYLWKKPAERARTSAFLIYHDVLHERLDVCEVGDRDRVMPCAETSTRAR
jgi:hypothetical protein